MSPTHRGRETDSREGQASFRKPRVSTGTAAFHQHHNSAISRRSKWHHQDMEAGLLLPATLPSASWRIVQPTRDRRLGTVVSWTAFASGWSEPSEPRSDRNGSNRYTQAPVSFRNLANCNTSTPNRNFWARTTSGFSGISSMDRVQCRSDTRADPAIQPMDAGDRGC